MIKRKIVAHPAFAAFLAAHPDDRIIHRTLFHRLFPMIHHYFPPSFIRKTALNKSSRAAFG
jgi:hypothetical protein